MRESAKAAAPISGVSAGIVILGNYFKVAEMIASTLPYLKAFLPLIGVILVSFSFCLAVGLVFEWSNKRAGLAVTELEEFVQAGLSVISPLHFTLTVTSHRDNKLRTIGSKYRKLLGVKDKDADFAKIITKDLVDKAIRYTEIFKRYSYLRGRIIIRRIIAKSKQKPLTWWPF